MDGHSQSRERHSKLDLVDKLKTEIIEENKEEALSLISQLDGNSLEIFEKNTNDGERIVMDILHNAAVCSKHPEILEKLVERFPDLLTMARTETCTETCTETFKGLTVLHTLVSNGDTETVKRVMALASIEEREKLLSTCYTGSMFKGMAMVGQLPLTIAALTMDREMVLLLAKECKADLKQKNSRGDNVLHSIIWYSNFYPEKEEDLRQIMEFLHDEFIEKLVAGPPGAVWFTEDDMGFTPLKLAARLCHAKLFNFILNIKGVYCHLNEHHGMFDHPSYDITEIDSAATCPANKQPESVQALRNQVAPAGEPGENSGTSNGKVGGCLSDWHGDKSVLEILYELAPEKSIPILKHPVVRNVLEAKFWNYFRWSVCCLFYFAMMISLPIFFASSKIQVMCYKLLSEQIATSDPSKCPFWYFYVVPEIQVLTASIGIVCFSVITLLSEIPRCQKGSHRTRHWMFRLSLVGYAICLTASSIWYWFGGTADYLLIIGVLLGIPSVIFFFRPYEGFSFFFVILHRVLLGDMFRFAFLMAYALLFSSLTMTIVFARFDGHSPTEFRDIFRSSITMFRLLIGLTEADVLYDAPEPWLAIILFGMFVLIAHVLLLNALIAQMTHTIANISQDLEFYFMRERLSVYLFIEASLPSSSARGVGKAMSTGRFVRKIEPDLSLGLSHGIVKSLFLMLMSLNWSIQRRVILLCAAVRNSFRNLR
ncbi:transient receptor potential cation channel subfamily V member 5-like [Littorina saxatilis]|uniref:Ion transport domain-containing protein n=1 Tax=Littorina saxatilis TaxID=31220 RepID=A0AAN9C364_9CAEN